MSPALAPSPSTSPTSSPMADSIARVAITGAAGYLGGALIRRLERDEAIERILAIDVRPPRQERTSKVTFHRRDVTQPLADLLGENGVEAVVNLAFVLNPGHRPEKARQVNVDGSWNVLEACAQAGVGHVLYVSSSSVYGAHRDNPPLLTEESPPRPVKGFQYSEDKAAAESMIARFAGDHLDVTATVLRGCPVIGPTADNFISRAFSKPFLVGVRGFDPGLQFIHEDDMAKVMHLCLLHRASGTYNVAGSGTIRWSEMAKAFGRRLLMLPAPLVYGLTGAAWRLRLQSDSPASGLDLIRYGWAVSTEKMERDLGFTPRYSSRDAWESFVQRHQPAPREQTPR